MPSYSKVKLLATGCSFALEVWQRATYLIINKSLPLLLALWLHNADWCDCVQLGQIQLCLCIHPLLLLLQVLRGGARFRLDFLRRRTLDIALAGFAHSRGR